jgi:hypothetical protein
MTISKTQEDPMGLKEIFSAIGKLGGQLFQNRKLKKESVSFSNLYEMVWTATWDLQDWFWLVDLYVEETTGELFALFAKEGLLYKAPITVETSKISIGEIVQVQEVFNPVQNGLMIRNQADGTSRWFLISSSSVLNRSASIDSTQLFDNLVKRCQDTGKYPYLTYYHLGAPLKMGTTDWVARDGNLLLSSGTFEKDNKIAECMKEAYEKDPSYWGASIAFWPYKGQMEPIAEGISVPMYTDGEFEEISILAEEHANCLFTSLYSNGKVTHMRDDLVKQINVLTGGNKELTDKIVSAVDSTNEDIQKNGLITRQAPDIDPATPPAETPPGSTTAPASPPASSEVSPTEPATSKVVEVDDELVKDIVQQMVKEPIVSEALKPIANLTQSIEDFKKSFETRMASLETQSSETKSSIEGRLQKLELDDKAKKEEWEKNLPRSPAVKIQYRAKAGSELEEKPSPAEIAAQTLEKLGK